MLVLSDFLKTRSMANLDLLKRRGHEMEKLPNLNPSGK